MLSYSHTSQESGAKLRFFVNYPRARCAACRVSGSSRSCRAIVERVQSQLHKLIDDGKPEPTPKPKATAKTKPKKRARKKAVRNE
jgi:hypothetical protein